MVKLGKKDKLKQAVKEAHKELLERYEPTKVLEEEDYDYEEMMFKVLEIRSNILKYVEDYNLPMCEYMSIEVFSKFMNKICLAD